MTGPPPSSSTPSPTASTGAALFPPHPSLSLLQVNVYSRHGERTPVRTRMTEHFPARWNLCHIASEFSSAVTEVSPADPRSRAWMVGRWKKGGGEPGECLLGELTDIGRETTLDLGRKLRKAYVDDLKFLAPTPKDEDLYLRSTHMGRTIESLQQVIAGLYPAETRGSWTPEIQLRNMTEESLLPNTFGCARLAQLDKDFAKAAAAAYNHTLEKLDSKLSKFVGGRPIRINGSPAVSGIMDTVRAAEANGMPIPEEFRDQDARDTMENAICHEWFGGYNASHEFRTLAMGRALSDLKANMSAAISGAPGAKKLLVQSCHDTSLAGMLATLGVFDHKWPDFTAHISVELFQGPPVAPASFPASLFSSSKPSHYVRMRYQDQPLDLPACAKAGHHLQGRPELCTFEAFSKAVEAITPRDWADECKVVVTEGSGRSS